jgi:hypothetical protein
MVLLRLLAFKPADTATAEKKTLNDGQSAARMVDAPPPVAPVEAPAAPVLAAVRAVSPLPPTATAPAVQRQAAPASALPAGQRLPVREAPPFSAGPAPVQEPPARVLAMPVRVQPAPGAREQMRESETPVAVIEPSEEGDFWHATVQQMVVAEAIGAHARAGAAVAAGGARRRPLAAAGRARVAQPAGEPRALQARCTGRPCGQNRGRGRRRHRQPGAPQCWPPRRAQQAAEQIILNDPVRAADAA